VLEMRLMNDWAESASCEIIFAKIECMVISLGRHLQNGATVSSAREFTVENTKEKTKERVIERNIMLLVHPDRHPYVSTGVWDFRHVSDSKTTMVLVYFPYVANDSSGNFHGKRSSIKIHPS